MPPSRHGVHRNPFLGWNPPAGDSAWARAEAERRGVKLSTILTEALREYRAKHSARLPARAEHAPTCKCGVCKPPEDGGK